MAIPAKTGIALVSAQQLHAMDIAYHAGNEIGRMPEKNDNGIQFTLERTEKSAVPEIFIKIKTHAFVDCTYPH